MEYRYDLDELADQVGIESVSGDDNKIQVAVEGRNIIVLNGGNAPVVLFDMNGCQVAAGSAANVLDASGLNAGIYLLNVCNKAVKVVLK